MSDQPPTSPMVLLQQSIEALMANPVGYLLAGLGPMLILFPLTFGLVFLAYVALFAGAAPGMMLEDEMLAILGGVVAFMVVFVGFMVGMMVVLAPIYASLMRAVDAAQQGQHALGAGSAFGSLSQDLPKVFGVYGAVGALGLVGALMCYLPGLISAFLLEFAVPAVVLDRVSPIEALQRSARHVIANPGWSAAVFAITLGIFMILSQVPIVGYMVAMPLGFDFQVRAYRAAFK